MYVCLKIFILRTLCYIQIVHEILITVHHQKKKEKLFHLFSILKPI